MGALLELLLTAAWTGSSAGDFAIPRAMFHLLESQSA
jgi:hypothetical protein